MATSSAQCPLPSRPSPCRERHDRAGQGPEGTRMRPLRLSLPSPPPQKAKAPRGPHMEGVWWLRTGLLLKPGKRLRAQATRLPQGSKPRARPALHPPHGKSQLCVAIPRARTQNRFWRRPGQAHLRPHCLAPRKPGEAAQEQPGRWGHQGCQGRVTQLSPQREGSP